MEISSTLDSVSGDVLDLILKRLDIKSATNLLQSSKRTSEKVSKYIYPRLWVDYGDLVYGDYKKEDYIYIYKIKNVTDLDHLKDFKNVREIAFVNGFNQEVDNLPSSLTHLLFGHNFNQKVDKLPLSLRVISFRNNFNQEIDKLPLGVTHLYLGLHFNQEIDHLPSSLTHLTFGFYFDQEIDNLPSTLTHLTIPVRFNKKVYNLPSSLTHLTIGDKSVKI